MSSPPGSEITTGTTLRSRISGAGYTVEGLLGAGGQGQVWRVVAAAGSSQPYAVKWYFPQSATPEQFAALQKLVQSGSPNRRFLWPLEMLESDVGGFGYVMELRGEEYCGMTDVINRKIEPTFRALATAGFQLADSFLQLHSKGLCYMDISFGNVFVEPDSGAVLVCDNDNVRVDGQPASVAGTHKFMAPEVIQNLVDGTMPLPGRSTDLFSLSVLLFYMFMMHHPFEGNKEADIVCLDGPSQNEIYGLHPVFIFDPDDDSNRPHPDYHQNALVFWPMYPQFLRDLFTRAFTEGVRDAAHGRVQESEWRQAMVQLRDSIVLCSNCGVETFLDDSVPGAGFRGKPCWNCSTEVQVPARLELRRGRSNPRTVMLNGDTVLYPHHLTNDLYNFSRPLAEVVAHPDAEHIWGLRNLSDATWNATLPGGQKWEVPQGRSVTIGDGVSVAFGNTEGRIKGSTVSPANPGTP